MSAISDITVYNGAATPVALTFTAISISRVSNEITALWRQIVGSVPTAAQPTLTLKQTKLKSGVTRTSYRVDIPVMEAPTGGTNEGYTAAPKVAYSDAGEYVSYAHSRSLQQGRRDVRMLCVNLGNNVATSVAAATAGQIPIAIDLHVLPT